MSKACFKLIIVIVLIPLVTSAFLDFSIGCTTAPIRKSWARLTVNEQQDYLRAVYRMAQGITVGSTTVYLKDFGRIHSAGSRYYHYTSHFLSWHRHYMARFEQLLQRAGSSLGWDLTRACSLAAHYWETEIEPSNTVYLAPLRANTFGTGVSSFSCGIRDGWFNNNIYRFVGVGCCTACSYCPDGILARQVNPSAAMVSQSLLISAFFNRYVFGSQYGSGFASNIELNPHGAPHNKLGGCMVTMLSPEDPIFFLHHSNIDRWFTLWSDMYGYDHYELTANKLDTIVPGSFPSITYRAATYAPWSGSGSILSGTSENTCLPYPSSVPGLFTDAQNPLNCATPRNMYNIGTSNINRGFNGMWYRYDPNDNLIPPLETVFGQRNWNLFPGNKKRSAEQRKKVLFDDDSDTFWNKNCKNKTGNADKVQCMANVEFYECKRDKKESYAGAEWLSHNPDRDLIPEYWLSSCSKQRKNNTNQGNNNNPNKLFASGDFLFQELNEVLVQSKDNPTWSTGAVAGTIFGSIVILAGLILLLVYSKTRGVAKEHK